MKLFYFTPQYVFFAIYILFFSSCTFSLYSPSLINTPVLREKDEIKINASGGLAIPSVGGLDLQAAYAIEKNKGIMLNYNTFTTDGIYSRDFLRTHYGKGSGKNIEAGYGIINFDTESSTFFEVYGMAGLNYFDGSIDLRNFKSSSYIFSVQPSIGISGKYADVIFTSKFSYLSFVNYSAENNVNIPELNNLRGASTILIQPALTLRLGFGPVKIQGQFLLNLYDGNSKFGNFLSGDYISTGLIIDIAKWYSKTKKK